MSVRSGLDVLCHEGFARLKGRKVGLLAHPASVDSDLRHAIYLMHEAGVSLDVLFGPEHGVLGDAQDMEIVEEAEDAIDRLTGARIFSLYGNDVVSLHPEPHMLDGLDVVVVDLQDVGARYYTFAATMVFMMEVAAKTGTEIIVLDRPNPLGGDVIEGPAIHSDFHSFVGAYDLPIRHGLTMGEYAKLLQSRLQIDVKLDVVQMSGYERSMHFEATGLPWVFPSPNMPTVDTAWIYPGMCLFEGTQMSEGRGTTRPFELSGAPWMDGVSWKRHTEPFGTDGVVLRPCYFTPTFQKHAKARCGGVQIHVTDRSRVRSVALAVSMLHSALALEPDQFQWRTQTYEYVNDRLAIDLLFGSEGPRTMLEDGAAAADVIATFRANETAFAQERAEHLIY